MKTLAFIIPLLVGCAGTQAAPQSPTVPTDCLHDSDFDSFIHGGGDTPQPSPTPAPRQPAMTEAERGITTNLFDHLAQNYDITARFGFIRKGAGDQISIAQVPTQVLPDSAAKEPSKPPVVKQNIEPPKAPPVEVALPPAKAPTRKGDPFAIIIGAQWCTWCGPLDRKVIEKATSHLTGTDGIEYYRVQECAFGLVDLDNNPFGYRAALPGEDPVTAPKQAVFTVPCIIYFDDQHKETARTSGFDGSDAAFNRMLARHGKSKLTAAQKAAVLATASQPNVTYTDGPKTSGTSAFMGTTVGLLPDAVAVPNGVYYTAPVAAAPVPSTGIGFSVLGVPIVQGSAW